MFIIYLFYNQINNYLPLIIVLSLKEAFKDIYEVSIDVTNIKKAKGNIDEIAVAIKGLNAEQAIYRMELAGCSKIQMMDAYKKMKLQKKMHY